MRKTEQSLRRFSHKEMAMTLDLPKPIAAYFTADKGDTEAFSQCFTEEAIVKDEGHTYRGRYVSRIACFAKHFGRSPELLVPDEVRAFQLHLLERIVSYCS